MKIFYVSHSKIPSHLANAVHVMKMCQAFAQLGHTVTLFAKEGTFRTDNDFNYYGVKQNFEIIKVPKILSNLFSAIYYVLKIPQIIKKLSLPDIFYTRHLYCIPMIIQFKKPIIVEAHQPPQNALEKLICKSLFRSELFSHLVVISPYLHKEFTKIFHDLPADKVQIAHDAADPATTASEELQWPGRDNHLQVGYVGNLYKGRGVELIVSLAEQLPDIDFHIIGGGPTEAEEWKNKTSAISNLYFHGFIPPRLGDAYRNKMQMLLAPYQESVAVGGNKGNTVRWMSPLKIFEYMSSGKAIIASDLSAIKEVLSDGINALLVPPSDVDSWKSAVIKLEDNNIRQELGKNALEKFQKEYTWQARAQNILKNTVR